MDWNIEDQFSRLSLRQQPPPLRRDLAVELLENDLYGRVMCGVAWSGLGSKEREIRDYRGMILSLARDQSGSRFLQMKLERGVTREEIETILMEIKDDICELVKDQNANFFVQKLIKACDERQITMMIFWLCVTRISIIQVCLNPYGTRAIQKLLECVTSYQQVTLLVSALSYGTALLSVDPNGHHVIQHCLMRFSDQDIKQILFAISRNCFKIATSKSGCCVLQSCLDHCRGEYKDLVLADIIANARHLSEDPYGNYVIQHLLGLKVPEIMENLWRQLRGSFLSLSSNKFASNVVEKLLIGSSTKLSSMIITELIRSPNVCLLLVNAYGNFVIQSALVVSQGLDREALLRLIRINAHVMQKNHYGKKVLERVMSL